MRSRVTLALVLVAGVGLGAQEGISYGMLHVGRTKYDTKPYDGSGGSVDDGTHFGLGVGHWYRDQWGVDVRLLNSPMNGSGSLSPFSAKRNYLLGSLNFNFNPGGSWWPYLAIGVGGTETGNPFSGKSERTTHLSFHGGLGFQAPIADNLMWGMDWKAVRTSNDQKFVDHLFTVGLGWRFSGWKKAAPPPLPAPAPVPAPEPPKPAPAPEPPPPPPPPPAPEPPKEEAKPVPPPPPQKFILDEASLHFGNGKADVDETGAAAIRKVAESLKAFTGKYTVVVTGHTSSVGGKALNKALSKKRAEAVAKILVDAGVPASAVAAEGAGPDKPLADNRTKEGQAKNRRVEIDVKAEGENVEVRKTETDLKQ